MGIVLILVLGLALMAGPVVFEIAHIDVSGLTAGVMFFAGLLITLFAAVLLIITKLYRKTQADEALVKTGMGGLKIIKDGGAVIIPVIHRVVPVTLRTFKLDVLREGKAALITRDKLRADIGAEFFVRVMPDDESIQAAARSLGERMGNIEAVRALVEDKLVSALRSVSAQKTLEELNSDRESFMEEVMKSVSNDLKHNGLTLETATISKLDQTSTENLDPNNVFDAEGLATIAKITELKMTEANARRREGEQARKDQDVTTRKRVLQLEQAEAEAEANQMAEVAKVRADRKRESEEKQIEAQRQIDLAAVQKEQAVQVASQRQQKDVEVAERERQQAVEVAEQKKLEATTRAAQEVEVAERQKLQAIAAAEREVAASETAKAQAEAEREEARQSVQTVAVIKEAERQKQREIIAAQADAEKRYVEKQRSADAEAYSVTKDAEARKTAADADAEAIRKKAEADRDAEVAKAAGKRANEMVPVEVNERQVAVDQARVENVVKPELEAREKHGKVAQDFELAKLQISKEAEVRIASANAAATVFRKIEAKLYGTPEQVSDMTKKLLQGQGFGEMANGLVDSLEGDTLASVVNGLTAVKGTLGALAKQAGISEEELASSAPVVVDKTDAKKAASSEKGGNSTNSAE